MCLGTGMDEGGSQRSMRVYVPSMGGSLCSLHSSISLQNSVPHLKLKKNQICEKRETNKSIDLFSWGFNRTMEPGGTVTFL